MITAAMSVVLRWSAMASSGMRVGEMVALNRDDISFNERECVVFGKGRNGSFISMPGEDPSSKLSWKAAQTPVQRCCL